MRTDNAFLAGPIPDPALAADLLCNAVDLPAALVMVTPPDPERTRSLEGGDDQRTRTLARSSRDRSQLTRLCTSPHLHVRFDAAANPYCPTSVARNVFAAVGHNERAAFTTLTKGGCTPAEIVVRWNRTVVRYRDALASLVKHAAPEHRWDAYMAAATLCTTGDARHLGELFVSQFGAPGAHTIEQLCSVGARFDDSEKRARWVFALEQQVSAASGVVARTAVELGVVEHPLFYLFHSSSSHGGQLDDNARTILEHSPTTVVDDALFATYNANTGVTAHHVPLLERCSDSALRRALKQQPAKDISKRVNELVRRRFAADTLSVDTLDAIWATITANSGRPELDAWSELIAGIDSATVTEQLSRCVNDSESPGRTTCLYTWIPMWADHHPDELLSIARQLVDQLDETHTRRLLLLAGNCGADPKRIADGLHPNEHSGLAEVLATHTDWPVEVCAHLDTYPTTLADAICARRPVDDRRHLETHERALHTVSPLGLKRWLAHLPAGELTGAQLRTIVTTNPAVIDNNGDNPLRHWMLSTTGFRTLSTFDPDVVAVIVDITDVSVTELVKAGWVDLVARTVSDAVGEDPEQWRCATSLAASYPGPLAAFRTHIARLAATWPSSGPTTSISARAAT